MLDVDGSDRSEAFLSAYPTLPLDTKHFDAAFVDRLLASFPDLDGSTDGVLVHGDNWQALHFLNWAYQGQVQCVYIDPPFNSKSTEILYKNQYKHSSWLDPNGESLESNVPTIGEIFRLNGCH